MKTGQAKKGLAALLGSVEEQRAAPRRSEREWRGDRCALSDHHPGSPVGNELRRSSKTRRDQAGGSCGIRGREDGGRSQLEQGDWERREICDGSDMGGEEHGRRA